MEICEYGYIVEGVTLASRILHLLFQKMTDESPVFHDYGIIPAANDTQTHTEEVSQRSSS